MFMRTDIPGLIYAEIYYCTFSTSVNPNPHFSILFNPIFCSFCLSLFTETELFSFSSYIFCLSLPLLMFIFLEMFPPSLHIQDMTQNSPLPPEHKHILRNNDRFFRTALGLFLCLFILCTILYLVFIFTLPYFRKDLDQFIKRQCKKKKVGKSR